MSGMQISMTVPLIGLPLAIAQRSVPWAGRTVFPMRLMAAMAD